MNSKFCIIVFLCLFLNNAFFQTAKNTDFSGSKETSRVEGKLPPDSKWKLVWNDEFDGSQLDSTKWSYRLHIMHSRHKTWTKDGAELDGKESWKVVGPVSHREQFIVVSTECMGYRNGAPSPLLKNAILPDYFIVDYVRVYDEVK